MTEELERLWALRGLDEEVASRLATLSKIPQQRRELESRVEFERGRLEESKKLLTDLQLRRRQRERDIETASEQERKFQSQLPAIKKNEEYTALLHEIEAAKSKRSEIETEVLVQLEEEDKLQRERPSFERALATAEEERKKRLEVLDRTEREERERVALLETERSGHLEHLPPATRARYERVHASREGRAVVPILKVACGGCYRNQPPQILQEAKRGDRILTCEGCGRLLLWPPDSP